MRVDRVEEPVPEQPGGAEIRDREGRVWTVTESGLTLEGDATTRRARVAAQRAFWFGWYAQFPETILIK